MAEILVGQKGRGKSYPVGCHVVSSITEETEQNESDRKGREKHLEEKIWETLNMRSKIFQGV